MYLYSQLGHQLSVGNLDSTEKPDPPLQVEARDPTSKSITVTWKAPDNDGGCPIQGYIVEKIEKDGDRYERVTPSLVPGFSYVVKGLTEGMEYQFRVRAENAAGVSEPSRSTQPIKAADPVGMEKLQKFKKYLFVSLNFFSFKLLIKIAQVSQLFFTF